MSQDDPSRLDRNRPTCIFVFKQKVPWTVVTLKAVESAWVAWAMVGSRWIRTLERSSLCEYSSKSGVRSNADGPTT